MKQYIKIYQYICKNMIYVYKAGNRATYYIKYVRLQFTVFILSRMHTQVQHPHTRTTAPGMGMGPFLIKIRSRFILNCIIVVIGILYMCYRCVISIIQYYAKRPKSMQQL